MFFQPPTYKFPESRTFFEEKVTVNNYELDDHDKFILQEVEDSLEEYSNTPLSHNENDAVANSFSDDTILEMAELLLRICNNG